MKKFTAILAITAFFSAVSGYGQRGTMERVDNGQMAALDRIEAGNDIAYYHVVEKINMNFGSRETTYNVPTLSMVSKSELGPNNSRTITPKYGKPRNKEVVTMATSSASIVAVKPELGASTGMTIPVPPKPENEAANKDDMIVKIDLLRTYERVLDKGYKSVDMLKKVANGRFFDGNLTIALKHYDTLFGMTDDLEPIYYYRYAQCLKADGQSSKASRMMDLFKQKDN